MTLYKTIVWGILAIAFTGIFLRGWTSFPLWDEIFVGLLAGASWLMTYKESRE